MVRIAPTGAGGGGDSSLFPSDEDRGAVVLGDLEALKYHQTVNVRLSKRTKQHDIIGGDTVVQELGDAPDEIDIVGPVTESEKDDIEDLVENNDIISVSSDEWDGKAIIEDVRLDPTNGRHDGSWLYDLDMGLVEVTHLSIATTQDDTEEADDSTSNIRLVE